MGRLKRLFGGLSGITSVRTRHSRNPSHLEVCWECHAAVQRERQYLERLRKAAVPEASHDLNARLLARTRQLAEKPGSEQRGPASLVSTPAHQQEAGRWGSAVAKVVGVSAGGVLLAAGILAVGAYIVGGEKPVQAFGSSAEGNANAASLAQASAPLDGNGAGGRPAADRRDVADTRDEDARDADTSTTAGNAYFIPGRKVALSSADLAHLRSQGWACPELESIGFRLIDASASIRGLHYAVELRLNKGAHQATVVEEHLRTNAASLGSNVLRVSGAPEWQAVYRTPAALFTYRSNLPAEEADDAVPELVRAAASLNRPALSDTVPAPESVLERVQRGLRTFASMAGY